MDRPNNITSLKAVVGGIGQNAAILGGQPRGIKVTAAGGRGTFIHGNANKREQREFGGMGARPGAKVGGVGKNFAILDD